MTLRCAIVDDEPLARQRIRDLLAGESGVEIVAECEDGIAALQTLPSAAADLLFLDIQMPGLDGFEVLRELDSEPVIIFTTAFDSYALRAFEAHAIDYLLKPIDEERFRAAMTRACRFLEGTREEWPARLQALVERLDRRQESLRRIVVKSGGRVFFIETREVDYFEAAGNYVRVHAGGEAHLVRLTMQTLDARLDGRVFVRIHRSIIVNSARIAELQARTRGDYDVVLRSGAKLELQRSYRPRLQAVLGDF